MKTLDVDFFFLMYSNVAPNSISTQFRNTFTQCAAHHVIHHCPMWILYCNDRKLDTLKPFHTSHVTFQVSHGLCGSRSGLPMH